MTFVLGARSLKKLEGVHDDLVKVTKLAITLSKQDFTIVQGLRTHAEQEANVKNGASQTMRSRHLTGHAIDVAAWTNGEIDWDDEDSYREIAQAFLEAAKQLNTEVLWGGAWDLALNYRSSSDDALAHYLADCKKRGKRPFLDIGHFQLTWRNYP